MLYALYIQYTPSSCPLDDNEYFRYRWVCVHVYMCVCMCVCVCVYEFMYLYTFAMRMLCRHHSLLGVREDESEFNVLHFTSNLT